MALVSVGAGAVGNRTYHMGFKRAGRISND